MSSTSKAQGEPYLRNAVTVALGVVTGQRLGLA